MSDSDPSLVEDEDTHISNVFVINKKASKFTQCPIQSYKRVSNLLSDQKLTSCSTNNLNSKSTRALNPEASKYHTSFSKLKLNSSSDSLLKRMTSYKEKYALNLQDAKCCNNQYELKECSFIPLVNRSFSKPRTRNQFYMDQVQHIELANTHRIMLKNTLELEAQKQLIFSPSICKSSENIFNSTCNEKNSSIRLSQSRNHLSHNCNDTELETLFTPRINKKSANLHRTYDAFDSLYSDAEIRERKVIKL